MKRCDHPKIVVDGDRATGAWYLEHAGYRRTCEATMSMDDLPGRRLKIGAAYE